MTFIARFARAAGRLALGATLLVGVPSGFQPLAAPAPLGLPLAPTLGSAATLNVPPNATAEQLRDASLRQLGWTPAAVSYVGGPRADGRVRVLLTYLPNQQSACKADWACLTGYFPGANRVQITTDPADGLFARGFSHEFGHAINDARGYSDNTAGSVLYDLLELSQDPASYPEAAWGARQILQLRDDDGGRADTLGYHTMLDNKDFSHLSIALLEFGVGNDEAKLPDWFRQAYYPYLQPGTPRLARPIRIPTDIVPGDIAARLQRVVDLIAKYCGPVLPGAQTQAATTCVSHAHLWPDVPYTPYPGANSTGPAAPGVPHAPIVDAIPVAPPAPQGPPPAALPPPVVSHIADQGVVVVSRVGNQGVVAATSPIGPAAPASSQATAPGAISSPTPLVLPQTQPGQSPDEGSILTPSDAIGQVYYFIAAAERFNLTEPEVEAVMSADPLAPLLSAPRERIAQYYESPPPGQGRLGLLEGLDTLPARVPAAD